VSVNAVAEAASCRVDWRLLVPESCDGAAMAGRRAACHLPEDVHHRPTWQLVLDMLDELERWELHPPVLVANAGDGEVGEFRTGWTTARSPRGAGQGRHLGSPEQAHPDGRAVYRAGSAPAAALPRQAHLPQAPGLGGRAAGGRRAHVAAGQQGPAALPALWPWGPPGRAHPGRHAAGRTEGAGWKLPVRWLLAEGPKDKAEPVK
jgi:hypothetical protein